MSSVRDQSQHYVNLMVYWRELQLEAYLANDPARYKWAIQIIAQRQAALNTLGNKKDKWDYDALSDCTRLLEHLTKRLNMLTSTAPRRGANAST